MNKKNVIKILVFTVIIILAILFMFLGAKEEGRKYSIEEVKEYKYFVVQKDGKYGVIDKEAKDIVDAKYENIIIPNPSKPIFICETENKNTKILNEKQEEIFTEYEEVSYIKLKNTVNNLQYEKSVLKYKKDSKYGIIDFDGDEITDAIYDSIDSLGVKEGALLVEQNGKYGAINIKGITLVPINYQIVKSDEYNDDGKFSNSGYIVGIKTNEGYRYGYIDIEGNKVLDTEFNEISRINDISQEDGIVLLVSKNGQYGIYKNKEQVIKNSYQAINYNNDNKIFILEKGKKFGVADLNGNILIDVKYSQIDINGKYLYVKGDEEKTEVYDTKGKLTNMSPDISKQEVADGKYFIVIENKEDTTKYGIQDSNEKELVKLQYNYLEYLFDNYFMASNEEGKIGIIDEKGNVKLELSYDSIQKIQDTKLINVSKNEGNITEIYSDKIEKVYNINDATVEKINDYVLVDSKENKVYISSYGKIVESNIVYPNNSYFAKAKEGKWGFVDTKGDFKVEARYDRVTEFNEYGYAGIMIHGKWGVIDSNLKVILEPKYELQFVKEPSFLGVYYKVDYGFGDIFFSNM